MKRFLTALALVSMINMAAIGGLAAVAFTKDWLAKDRVVRAFAVLRGEEQAEPAAATTSMPAVEADQPPIASSEQIRKQREADEIARTELERRRREIQNGWELLERQQLAFVQAKEAFEDGRKRYEEETRRRAEQDEDGGFRKELDIIAGLKAKDAKELLRLKQDADVVRILMEMEPRKARKIVGECKKSDERLWIGRILEKLHDRNAVQAEVLAAGN